MMRYFAPILLCCLLLLGLIPDAPVSACTSFCMDTSSGPVFGTNLDLFIPGDGLIFVNRRGVRKQTYQTNTAGQRAKWNSKYGSVTFSLVGREWAWGGMNEAGLVISSMELRAGEFPEPDDRPALFEGNWAQYMLDNFGCVKEVIRADSNVAVRDQGYTSHYLVADADGHCAAIEFLDGKSVVYTGKDMPVKALSNMRYDRALSAYRRGGPRWWWSNPGQSAERFAACQARSENFDLKRNSSAVKYAFETLMQWVAAPHTKWNIVYDIPKREIWYRTDQSPALKHISLSRFDFSCNSSKMMLDVNAPLDGDVETYFVPYDYKVSLNVFRTFCERYGIKITEREAADFTAFFENFECLH